MLLQVEELICTFIRKVDWFSCLPNAIYAFVALYINYVLGQDSGLKPPYPSIWRLHFYM